MLFLIVGPAVQEHRQHAQGGERAPADGESHLSTQLGSVLVFDASGQAVDATLANGADSGNNMVFALLVDDETVYTSETVAPSESVSSIQLDVFPCSAFQDLRNPQARIPPRMAAQKIRYMYKISMSDILQLPFL